MKLKIAYLIFVVQIISLNASSQTKAQTAIQQFVNSPGLQHASIGFCVKDLTGKQLAGYNVDKSYTPASILKVITTATAFEVLGPNFRYETTLAKDPKNAKRVLIHGYGDPTLGTEHLDNIQYEFVSIWANEIAKAYEGEGKLDLLVIDDYFGYRGVSRKWIHEDLGNYFAAGSYGISIFDNTYRLSFNTKGKGSIPEMVGTDPKMNDITFTNTLTVNSSGKDNGYILGAPFSNERTIIGNIPENRTKFTIKGDIPNPGLFLGQTLSSFLGNKDISVNSIATTYDLYHQYAAEGKHPEIEENIFYTHRSPSLAEIAKNVNTISNNHYAEHLIRTIGRAYNNDIYSLALEEGIEKVEKVWKANGLNTDALFMYDGSGLAPTNAVSAEFMCDVLLYMQTKSDNAIPFLESFPKAGKTGTVRNLLKGTRLDGKVFVKSGSIANVQCFAGYYMDGEKKYTFTIMVNKYSIPRNQVVKAIEKLLLGVL